MGLRIATTDADGPEAVPEVVERLEMLLEKAKRGEIVAIAYACALADRDWSCTGYERAGGTSKAGAYYALEQLRHRMLTE